MHKFEVGDIICITTEDKDVTEWAREFAEQGVEFEIQSVNTVSYWSRNLENGEYYGIAFKHAIPPSNGLLSQVQKESKKSNRSVLSMEIRKIKFISVEQLVRERKILLNLEIDYLLLSLHHAVEAGNEEEKAQIKDELEAIVEELAIIQA